MLAGFAFDVLDRFSFAIRVRHRSYNLVAWSGPASEARDLYRNADHGNAKILWTSVASALPLRFPGFF